MNKSFIVIGKKSFFGGVHFEVIPSQEKEWQNFARGQVGKISIITHKEINLKNTGVKR